jgi:hypothetical protein
MPALAGECIIRRRTSEQPRRRKLTTYYRDADCSNRARRAFGYVAAPFEGYAGVDALRGRVSTMKASSIATAALFFLSVSGADAQTRTAKLIMCDDPVVRDSLGMCADLSHEIANNEREREWIEAYELLQHYTGRALNPLFVPQMAGVCAMDYR